MHSWLPGYTFSQRSYTGVTSPLRMHVKMSVIQRNAHCRLSCARNLILTAYCPNICSVNCWIHIIVQFGVIEACVVHLIYEFDCIFSFFCQIFANRVFNYEFNLLQSLLNSLFIDSAKYKQVSTLSQFLGSIKFRVSQFYYFGDLSCRNFIFSQHFCLAASAIPCPGVSQFHFLPTFLSRSFGDSEPRRLAAWTSRNFIFSQHFYLAASATQSLGVSQLRRLAVLFSPNISVS